MFTLTFFDLEYDTSISSWDIWNHDRNLMIDLLYFSSLHGYIHRTQMKLIFIMKSGTLICTWILVYPIGIIEDMIPRKW